MADGARRYCCLAEGDLRAVRGEAADEHHYNDGSTRPIEAWGRESRALRFSKQEDAEQRGDHGPNFAAKEYLVVPLP
jgi:hypothetical protein